jgi:hypothetical protein
MLMGTVGWDFANPEMVMVGTEDGSETGDARELINFYRPMMNNDPRYVVGTWDECECIKIFYNTFTLIPCTHNITWIIIHHRTVEVNQLPCITCLRTVLCTNHNHLWISKVPTDSTHQHILHEVCMPYLQ